MKRFGLDVPEVPFTPVRARELGSRVPTDVEGMRFGARFVAGVALSVLVIVGLIVWVVLR